MGTNFVAVFNKAIDELEVDAKAVGLSLTSICRTTEISRATPDRWRKKTPTTVLKLAEMQKVVADKKQQIIADALKDAPKVEDNGAV